jgi:hypothetical protein
MSTSWVKVGYAILLGVVLAITVGFGVLTFESGPRPPQPAGLTFAQLNGTGSDADNARIAKQIDGFYSDLQSYREKFPEHQRNIFLWLAGIGMLVAVVGVALPRVVNYLRLGFVLGGLFLLVIGAWFALQGVPVGAPPASSLLTLFSSGTPKTLDAAGRFLRFAVSIVGLLVLLFVGLWRLTDWPAPVVAAEPRPLPGTVPAGYAAAPFVAELPPADPAATAALRPHVVETSKWGRPEERAGTESNALPPSPGAAALDQPGGSVLPPA